MIKDIKAHIFKINELIEKRGSRTLINYVKLSLIDTLNEANHLDELKEDISMSDLEKEAEKTLQKIEDHLEKRKGEPPFSAETSWYTRSEVPPSTTSRYMNASQRALIEAKKAAEKARLELAEKRRAIQLQQQEEERKIEKEKRKIEEEKRKIEEERQRLEQQQRRLHVEKQAEIEVQEAQSKHEVAQASLRVEEQLMDVPQGSLRIEEEERSDILEHLPKENPHFRVQRFLERMPDNDDLQAPGDMYLERRTIAVQKL